VGAHIQERPLKSAHIAHAHRAIFTAKRACINKEFIQGRHGVWFQTLAADYTARVIHKEHAAANTGERGNASDGDKARETVRVHMRNHQANFVNMRGNHHPQSAGLFGTHPGNQIAQRVRANFLGVIFNLLDDRCPD